MNKRSRFLKNIFLLTLCFVLIASGCGKNDTSDTPISEEDMTTILQLEDLTTNYKTNPLAVDGTPLFSWKLTGGHANASQSAYQLLVAKSEEDLASGTYIWDSGKVDSGISVAIPYEGPALSSSTEYVWTVNSWVDADTIISANAPARFRTGLTEEDWSSAKWITAPKAETDSVEKDGSEEDTVLPFKGTVSYRVYCPDSNSAFFWGADESYYGTYYRLAIDTTSDNVSVEIAKMYYEDVKDSVSFPIETEDSSAWEAVFHDIFLSVSDKDISVSVDEVPLGSFPVSEEKALGSFGFWTTRGAYYAYYDDLKITPTEGLEITEDFESADSAVFSPYSCKIKEKIADLQSGHCMLAESGFTITPDSMQPAPMFRKTFEITAEHKPEKAILHTAAFGSLDMYINGESVDDSFFGPGQSQYDKEVYYTSYDVTDLLSDGKNTLSGLLGHGRYDRAKCDWGDDISLCAVLQLQYDDDSVQTIISDDSWLCFTDGPIRNDDLYAGEVYDMRKESAGWNEIDFDDSSWEKAALLAFSEKQPEPAKAAAIAPPNRALETITPVSVTEPIPGTYVCDFGDNITGVCGLYGEGKADTPVVIRYAEKLNEENFQNADDIPGTIWTQGLFTARNTDYCIPASGELFYYMPKLVYRGFRYVQITGLASPLEADDITAFVITADNQTTGSFNCSDENINKLYNAIYRTQKNNYVDIPTDCPQRDERFGWAGDTQVFARTAGYNANVYNFLRSYLHTFVLAQRESGAFPDLLTSSYENGGSNGWADAGVILTWELYQQYGDTSVITENLDAMCRYVDYLVETSDDYIRTMDSYSDHIAESLISDEMCNTAECAYTANLLSKMCSVVSENELAKKYEDIYNAYKDAWQKNYLNEDGSVGSWMQSEYVLPLAFDLYPDELKEAGASYLNISVEGSGYHVNTGYVATPWLLPTLCEYGYVDSAYKLIEQDTFPSWNYMFSHDNTTLTESFHTFKDYEDGSYSVVGSQNHFALGSVGSWLYSDVLGIKRDENAPGYKHFILEPRVHNSLSFAEGSYNSMYGLIESRWTLNGTELTYSCVVPPGTTATLILPMADFEPQELEPGSHNFTGTLK